MGGSSPPPAPTPPDPVKTAQAQSQANRAAIRESAKVNQINQITPFGRTSWSGTIGGPDRTQTTSLNPEINSIFFGGDGLLSQIRGATNTPLNFGAAPGVRNQGFSNFSSSARGPGAFSSGNNPSANRFSGIAPDGREMVNRSPSFARQGGYDPREHGGGPDALYGGPGEVSGGPDGMFSGQRGVPPGGQSYSDFALTGADDFGAERAGIEQSVFDRGMNLLRPEFDRQEKSMNRDLWQRGLTDGSQAVNDTRSSFGDRRGRAQNDLALASVMAGSQEHQRLSDLNRANRGQLFGEDMNRSADARGWSADDRAWSGERRAGVTDRFNRAATSFGLNEQAIQNAFGRDLSTSQENRGIAQDQFGRDLATSAENRAGTNEQFGRDMANRQQSISEMSAARNQPISDLVSLLSGVAPGGVPNMPQYSQYTAAAPDIMGMTGSNYGAQANAHAAQVASHNNMMGGLFGGMLGLFSDRRLKRDIKKVGKLHNGLNVYVFRYKGTKRFMLGLMADEVEKMHPHAVHKSGPEEDAFQIVDYAKAVERKEE